MAADAPHDDPHTKSGGQEIEAREEPDAWSEFAPSFPDMFSKSQQLVAAVSKLGSCVGDFEIQSLLGEGAFGKVFLARQISLDREVALKITADLGQEGRTMARLEHARIVQVFSESIDPDQGLRLLCMQFVSGATLHQIIQRLRHQDRNQWNGQAILAVVDELSLRPATLDPASLRDRELLGRCPMDEAVSWIGQQLAEAIAYAHGRRVLHRDIKPANVIVNQYGQPMLSDFSLSFPTTGLADIGAAIFGGTLGYMAPEHLDALNPAHPATSEGVDERSDLYSLGAVLLDLLTGGPRETGDETGFSRMAFEQKVQAHRSVQRVEVALNTASVARPLAALIRRCLNSDPADRYQSAGELADALAGAQELLRTERSLPTAGLLTRWAISSPLWFILLLTVVPNLAASAVNIAYNLLVIIKELTLAQQSAFQQLVLWYNVVVATVMTVMVERTLLAAARGWYRQSRQPHPIAADLQTLRRQTLKLPLWTVVLGCVGWLPFVVAIPLGLEMWAGPIDHGVMLHVSLSFLVTGLIAIVCNYYVAAFVVLRVLYTRLWSDADRLHETAARELSGVPRTNRTFQVLAGLTPLGAATLLVIVGPDQFTAASFDRFRGVVVVLIGMGIAGFWLATTATALLNEVVGVLTGRRREDGNR